MILNFYDRGFKTKIKFLINFLVTARAMKKDRKFLLVSIIVWFIHL
ncbi:hypothetical protein AAJ76_200009010 [Vairimorpha ceranae]|uniref:Uncharacterized protein n=1 Tax=Vairimorpha ceranae TaxID=40302 RepID=A0A0F9WRC0_9MICR|nr:hypothetical protein AAJ76_200009010 [Vairimorpha ceranae]KKO75463.1 hypothetical protein AAJ76_200009010 [Vairimorpha ceranae]